MSRPLFSRIARWLIRRYPTKWRARYESEFVALLDESPAGVADVAELTRGLLVEHARALVSTVARASRTLSILAMLRPAFVIAVVATAVVGGYLLRRWQPGFVQFAHLAQLFYAAVLFTLIGVRIYFRRRQSPASPYSHELLPAWLGLIGLPITFVAILFFEWTYVESAFQLRNYWLHRFSLIWLYCMIVGNLASGFWPVQALKAFERLQGVEEQLRAAQKWVKGCHEMIALGVPSPLADAEANVERWTRERDKALEEAEQFGYRARFKPAK